MQKILFGLFAAVHRFIHRPWTVLWSCLGVVFFSVVIDGTLVRLWMLHRDVEQLAQSSSQLIQENKNLDHRIQLTKDPKFMEREARDRFDLVSEGDLVFIFAEEESEKM